MAGEVLPQITEKTAVFGDVLCPHFALLMSNQWRNQRQSMKTLHNKQWDSLVSRLDDLDRPL